MERHPEIFFAADPVAQFREWLDLARAHEPNDPEAMALATVAADGTPRVRMVLCKSLDESGARFFTNTESNKGQELAAHAHAAACFHWKSIGRQVRLQGPVEKLPAADDDNYFHTRPRESQIGAWASAQSRPLESIGKLITDFYAIQQKYINKPVPRPPYWGGYIIRPDNIEFWAQRPHRLHERMRYTRDGKSWQMQRLYP